ncbi:MAG: helix-turn-helix domain-containing protein [Victivallis vadensis]
MSFELSTDGPRLMRFPYPVCWAGATVEECKAVNDFYFTDRIEICLRLSSAEPEAVDEIDGRIYRTRFPHVFFKHPFHHLRYSYVQPRNAVHFSYAPETLAALRETGCFPPDGEFFREFRLTPELEILIRRFTELLGHTMERNALDRLDLTAYELLCELLLERNAPPDRQEFRRDDILAIASYLKQSFRHEIDYEELAHRHGLSLRSFFRCWGRHFEVSPARFVLKLKLEEAARRLRETSYTAADIAAFVRLGDCAYFAKVFRKYVNMSPTDFRKQKMSPIIL